MPVPIEKKYIEKTSSFLLPVERTEIPERIRNEASTNHLNEKTECHISVVVEKNAALIREAISKSKDPEKVKGEIVVLFNSFDWEYNLTDKYSLQEKFYGKNELTRYGMDEPEHTRRSIVQVVEMPDIEIFYKKVSKLLGIKLSVPLPHITIFGWSDYALKSTRGIGISSKEDFEINNKKYL